VATVDRYNMRDAKRGGKQLKVFGVKITTGLEEGDWHDLAGTVDPIEELERQWEAGVREFIYLVATAEIGIPQDSVPPSYRTIHLRASLGGIDFLSDTDEHRRDGRAYVTEEAVNLLGELRHDMRRLGVRKAEIDRAFKETDWGGVDPPKSRDPRRE
jgi:hypothetical protein